MTSRCTRNLRQAAAAENEAPGPADECHDRDEQCAVAGAVRQTMREHLTEREAA